MQKMKMIIPILLLSCITSSTARPAKATIESQQEQLTVIADTTAIKTYQSVKHQENYKAMEKFDLEKFNKNNDAGEYKFIEDGWKIRQIRSYDEDKKEYEYEEYRHRPNSPYSYNSAYDANGYLTGTDVLFYTFPIGRSMSYNKSGIGKEDGVDYDAPFKFSVDNLIDKMKTEYNIDLLDKEKIWDVARGISHQLHIPAYTVSVRVHYNLNHVYLIDGNTGKTLFVTDRETEWYPGQSQETVVDEYLRTLSAPLKAINH